MRRRVGWVAIERPALSAFEVLRRQQRWAIKPSCSDQAEAGAGGQLVVEASATYLVSEYCAAHRVTLHAVAESERVLKLGGRGVRLYEIRASRVLDPILFGERQ